MIHLRIKSLPFVLLIGALGLSSCASTQSDYLLTGERFAERPVDTLVDVFEGEAVPDQAYSVIGEVYVSKEGHLRSYTLENAIPELKVQARRVGANAIMSITEKRSRHLEAGLYIVSAKAIRYTDALNR